MGNKIEAKEVSKGAYRCSSCNIEFVGTECPECGNKKGNAKLASDGLDQELHGTANIFKQGLKSIEDADIGILHAKSVQAQMLEFDDNMRNAYVARSEIKNMDSELAKLRKQSELREAKAAFESGKVVSNNNPGPQPSTQGQEFGGFNISGSSMSPQTLFMSKLMKMSADDRKSFLNELSDADPQAMANLSSMMFQPPAMQMPQGGSGMYNMPPWMANQMYMNQMMGQGGHSSERQAPAPDPVETAVGMMTSMFELVQKMQPPRDDSMKDLLRELKDEIRGSRQKEVQSQVSDMKPVLDELRILNNNINSNPRRSIVDTVTEIKGLVEGLESIGLVKKPGAEGRTVDEELKLKEFDFKQETTKQELDIEKQRIDAERSRADMGKALLSAVFQKTLTRKSKDGNDAVQSKKGFASPNIIEKSAIPATPPEIIETFTSESGTVIETRSPVKKES